MVMEAYKTNGEGTSNVNNVFLVPPRTKCKDECRVIAIRTIKYLHFMEKALKLLLDISNYWF